MKVLVTGATGFVGGHVCRALIDAGHEVTAAVRRSGSAPEGTLEKHVSHLDGLTDWSAALAGQDAVVHLAARVHVMNETAENPWEEFRRANVEGTERLARDAAAAGVERFVFMSSIKASGESTADSAFDANDDGVPTDPYGVSKLQAEVLLRAIEEEAGLGVTIIRSPLVYGDGVGGNVRRLMKAIARGMPLPLAAVHNRRAMIYVENLAAVVQQSLLVPAVPQPLFASDHETVSTPDLIRELAMGMGRNPHLVWVPVWLIRLAGTVAGRGADIDRLVGSLEVSNNLHLLQGYAEVMSAREAIRVTGSRYGDSA